MSAAPQWVPPDMHVWLPINVWTAATKAEPDNMCDHDVFDSWIGGHRCPDMPRRIWFGPVMFGRIDQTPFAHDGECGWAVGLAGLFIAWTGWR